MKPIVEKIVNGFFLPVFLSAIPVLIRVSLYITHEHTAVFALFDLSELILFALTLNITNVYEVKKFISLNETLFQLFIICICALTLFLLYSFSTFLSYKAGFDKEVSLIAVQIYSVIAVVLALLNTIIFRLVLYKQQSMDNKG